jgi:predicted peptidase
VWLSADDPKPEDIRAANDAKKRYFLHMPGKDVKPPPSGWRLLVVMPGGDGSAEFAPFVGNMRSKSLGDEWLIVQMVAPQWGEEQVKTNTWPTEKSPYKNMKFSTEKLFGFVLDDVHKRKKIDPRYIFTLSWASSGRAGYAISLEPKTRVTGSFVAMSEFKPELLPPLKTAQNRAYYLLHSSQDTTVPVRESETALEELKKAGALIVLEDYVGGHGWKGEAFDQIKRGVEWLELQIAKPSKK